MSAIFSDFCRPSPFLSACVSNSPPPACWHKILPLNPHSIPRISRDLSWSNQNTLLCPYTLIHHKAFTNHQSADIPFLLGYFVVKWENGGPMIEKTPLISEDQVRICIFMTIPKSMVLIFGICWHKLPYLSPPKICVSIYQILEVPLSPPRLLT